LDKCPFKLEISRLLAGFGRHIVTSALGFPIDHSNTIEEQAGHHSKEASGNEAKIQEAKAYQSNVRATNIIP
jgi:hypothetical protein